MFQLPHKEEDMKSVQEFGKFLKYSSLTEADPADVNEPQGTAAPAWMKKKKLLFKFHLSVLSIKPL